jgi:hypothetical protein
MKLFHISQTENNNYDTFDSAVVAAESEDAARNTVPGKPFGHSWTDWCSTPELVTVCYIGEAAEGTPAGVICASFNAG